MVNKVGSRLRELALHPDAESRNLGPTFFYHGCTVLVFRMAHRNWKEINSQACCLAQLCLAAAQFLSISCGPY